MKTNALILHARRTGLGITRLLSSLDVSIHVADYEKSPGFYSNKIDSHHIISEPILSNYENLVDQLNLIGERIYRNTNEKTFLFTGSDDFLLFLSENHDKLSNYFRPTYETNLNVLLHVVSKIGIVEIGSKAGVEVPKSFTDYNAITSLEFPLIVKPEFKKTKDVDFVDLGLRAVKVNTLNELKITCEKILTNGARYVIQEFIPGEDKELYTVACYVNRGILKGAVCGKKERQFPPKIGECSYGKLIHNPEIIELSKKLVKEADFTGIAQIEFKKYNSKYYLIEINPRPFSWLELFRLAELNLAELAISINTEIKKHDFQGEKYWMFLLPDLYYNVLKFRNVSLTQWLKEVKRCNIFAFFDLKDIKPFYMSIILGLKKFNF